ncbi:pentatricopeptide repeat-containing protein [Dorcoceras hygrometricum]|uniref:Pentatricopeptide repeat-containing protein n=1 Tax=Dorcoceras hygrometricum TaxID=472368 RepID=A0A2Z7BVZ1_9LAMI|nr:pentatricopeptide repeat-containing protein [Dorcoceras hygrometricum]
MITCYSHNDDGHAAIRVFNEMREQSFIPDNYTYTSVLAALALVADREEHCQQLHCAVVKSGTGLFTSVVNALIAAYVKCASSPMTSSTKIFDAMDEKLVVAWNAMISGYVEKGLVFQVFEMFRKMQSLGINFDDFTYTNVLSACADTGLFLHGKQVHAYILRRETKSPGHFWASVSNALITLYWKWQIVEAASIFNQMREKNLLSWTVMISGLAQNGSSEEALKLFNQMKSRGLEPCDYAFSGAVISCAVLAALEQGRQLHGQLARLGFESSLSAGNALITMYSRCGDLDAAHKFFLTMPFLDSVSWNAMIAALGQHGHGVQALELFNKMLEENILPDRITFLTVLTSCSHAGLVEEGQHYFDIMQNVYALTPGEDHYARLIDLLCRAGKLSKAKDVIQSMPFEPAAPVWEALLSGSRLHGDIELGVLAAEQLFEKIPQHDGTYILLANMFATAGRWAEVAKVRKFMRDRGVKKEPGCSWLEVENKVHVFLVDDTVHPEVQVVYSYLKELVVKLRKVGYTPDTKFVLHDMESEQKEDALSTHSEKLAVVFGILKLPHGAAVRVFKNLRICGDCHNAFKFMSKVEARKIIVRDRKRFHHFEDGDCSCGDYW